MLRNNKYKKEKYVRITTKLKIRVKIEFNKEIKAMKIALIDLVYP